ncbi:MAG: hypothetical protein DI626_00845 [Micavibrio aeruginosavorus]|uniref:Uncharacterized protein n=1 Tax=Micavibrio aeruginosavorus TaxID=349221 RepID=A0A2W5A2T8_9BACT|nr:MAG: hypothetical protein DI626_00845 [Micavibrio aeruginosavorus]
MLEKEAIIESVIRDGQELTVSFLTAVNFVGDGTLDADRAEHCPNPCFFKTAELRLDCGSESFAEISRKKLDTKSLENRLNVPPLRLNYGA